jgi:uncharacterized protein YoxC
MLSMLPEWGQVAVTVAGVLIALGTIYRYVWPALKAFGRGVAGAVRVYRGTQQFVHDWLGGEGERGVMQRLRSIEMELRPNDGGSLRDTTDRTSTQVSTTGRRVEELQHLVGDLSEDAKANREGIASLREQSNDMSQRLTDLAENDTAQDRRISDHRRRNDETIQKIKEFLEGEHRDALIAREALQASVTELLNMQPDQPSSQGGTDDDTAG